MDRNFTLMRILDAFAIEIWANVFMPTEDYIFHYLENNKDNKDKTINLEGITTEYLCYFIKNGGISDFKFSIGNNSSNIAFIYVICGTLVKNGKIIPEKMLELYISTFKEVIKYRLKHRKTKNWGKIKGGKKEDDDSEDSDDNDDSGEKMEEVYLQFYGAIHYMIKPKKFKNIKNIEIYKKNNMSPEIITLCIPIGYYFHKDINSLIKNCVKFIKITHENPIGYICGITSAYMIYMAYNKVNINIWFDKIIELLKKEDLLNILNLTEEEFIDYNNIIRLLYEYREKRFVNGKLNITKSDTNFMHRLKTNLNITRGYRKTKGKNYFLYPGEDPLSSLLIAFDGLILCEGNFEKLIYYSVLNFGEMSDIACLAGELYNIIYGIEKVPKYLIDGVGKTENTIPIKFFEKIE